MRLFDRFGRSAGKAGDGKQISFPPVLKEDVAEKGSYAEWVRNHRWNEKCERWCRRQIEKIAYRPTIGVLMQSADPREELLQESLSSIFNQVYPFQSLYVVDRGSTGSGVRDLLKRIEKDPRVRVSYQAGAERDRQAIARIMKKADCEWLLLMGAEDVVEPHTLYNMVSALQSCPESDFVYSDSDLVDESGSRFNPQFKPVWAVGAHYPLGYYQHPVLMHRRLVEKLRGYERVSELMEEGCLLDEASNASRYAVQAAGVLYHARARGSRNEDPPHPADNVFLNENLVVHADNQIRINTIIRMRTEPNVPLSILWGIDSLQWSEGSAFLYNLARYLKITTGHHLTILSTQDGPLRGAYEQVGPIQCVQRKEAPEAAIHLHGRYGFDTVFVSSLNDDWYLPNLRQADIPSVWFLQGRSLESAALRDCFLAPTAILFPWTLAAEKHLPLETRGVLRILPPGVEMRDIKEYRRANNPDNIRARLGVPGNAVLITIAGPTEESMGQHVFVDACMRLLSRISGENIHFFIVGEREGPYATDLKDLTGKSRMSERFHFVAEPADPAEVYAYLWISDICVTCAPHPTFPIGMLQAMAFKKAVIAPDCFPTNQLVEPGSSGLLYPPGDAAQLAERMEELLSAKDQREAFGRRGHELAIERHSLKKSAAVLEQLLRESIVYM